MGLQFDPLWEKGGFLREGSVKYFINKTKDIAESNLPHVGGPPIELLILSGIYIIIIYLALVCFLLGHFFSWFRRGHEGVLVVLVIIMLCAVSVFVASMSYKTSVTVLIQILAVYGITLYIILCEVLLLGVAQWLTKKRGEKWVKELDYFYLALGLVGILGSANKIEQISGRFSNVDILAPMVLVTAVVIRFIKTRAEIADWHKPHADLHPRPHRQE